MEEKVNYKEFAKRKIAFGIYYGFLVLTILVGLSLVGHASGLQFVQNVADQPAGYVHIQNASNQMCQTADGQIHMVLQNYTAQMFYINSTNGVTFIKDLNFGNGTYTISYPKTYPYIDCYGNRVLVGFGAGRDKGFIYGISNNSGKDFTWKGINFDDLGQSVKVDNISEVRDIQLVNESIYVIYNNYGASYILHEQLTYSRNLGDTWSTPQAILNYSENSVINVLGNGDSSDKVYVFSRGAGTDLDYIDQFRSSYDGGATWNAIQRPFNFNNSNTGFVSMISKDNEVHLTFVNNTRAYYKNSNDSGVTWGSTYKIDGFGVGYSNEQVRECTLFYSNNGSVMALMTRNYSTGKFALYKNDKKATGWDNSFLNLSMTNGSNTIGFTAIRNLHNNFNDGKFNYITEYQQGHLSSLAGWVWFGFLGSETNGTSNLYVSLFDINGSRLNWTNITVALNSTETERTETGEANFTSIRGDDYILYFNGTGYPTSYYSISITGNTTTNLTVYLTPSNSTVTFNMVDSAYNPLELASLSMWQVINSSPVLVNNKTSDISGKIVYNYLEGVAYNFIAKKLGYNDKSFSLNPIVESAYNVILTLSSTPIDGVNSTTDVTAIYFTPSTFYNNRENQTLSFEITNFKGQLTAYEVNVTYPHGVSMVVLTDNGTLSTGETMNYTLNVSSLSFGQGVRLDLYYIANGVKKVKLYRLGIIRGLVNTLEGSRGNTYGLGLFERIILVTLFLLFVIGITFFYGSGEGGIIIGLLMAGYFIYIGFIPLWLFIVPIFIAVIILGSRVSQ